ncbi:MAG: DUF4124 domain-containing protein [Pseudomonadota bacterium]
MNTVQKLIATGTLALFFAAGPAEAGTVYLWVDENGVTQMKDNPPEGIPETRLKVMTYKDPPPPPPPTKGSRSAKKRSERAEKKAKETAKKSEPDFSPKRQSRSGGQK